MSESFDPYYKWLGISPNNQPPDMYRLLALELFESDPEVIEAAANRQMAYIRGCATGPYVGHSQKLLNEIAAARLCLLDEPSKAKYDAALRTKQSADRRPVPPIAGPPVAGPPVAGPPVAVAVPRVAVAVPRVAGQNKSGNAASLAAVPVEFDAAIIGSLPIQSAPRAPRSAQRADVAAAFAAAGVRRFAGRSGGHSFRTCRLHALQTHGARRAPASSLKQTAPTADSQGGAVLTAQQRREAAVPSGVPGSALTNESNSGTEGQHATDKSPAPPAPGPPKADPEAPFHEAEDALRKPDPKAAIAALERYLDEPAAANKPTATELIKQIKLATWDEYALAILAGMTDDQFAAFEQGQLIADFVRFNPAVVPAARETLQRNLAEAKLRRTAQQNAAAAAAGPAVSVAPGPAPGPAAEAGGDPLEVLKSKGLKRSWSTWILVEEEQLAELLEKAHSVDENHRSTDKEIHRSTARLESARRTLARDEAALKRAEAQDDAGAPADGQQRLRDKIEHDRDAVAQAEADLNQVNVQPDNDSGDATAAMADAQKLVAKIEAGYRRLADDPEVASALAKLGQRLGPSDQFKRLRGQVGRLHAGKPAS